MTPGQDKGLATIRSTSSRLTSSRPAIGELRRARHVWFAIAVAFAAFFQVSRDPVARKLWFPRLVAPPAAAGRRRIIA